MVRLTSAIFKMRIDEEFINQLDYIIQATYGTQIYKTNTEMVKELVKKEYDRLILKNFSNDTI